MAPPFCPLDHLVSRTFFPQFIHLAEVFGIVCSELIFCPALPLVGTIRQ